ncbi:hypothetical protein O1L60_45640 [Streptomyces diastatochromogenes]|nr:hypothetical protein [Streptomyces diastatochromogenes]
MNTVWPLSRSPVGTRRSWRKREELQRWLNGKQGPEWWEVVPAFAAVLAVLGLPLAGLWWLWSRVGWWAALLAAAALVYAAGARCAGGGPCSRGAGGRRGASPPLRSTPRTTGGSGRSSGGCCSATAGRRSAGCASAGRWCTSSATGPTGASWAWPSSGEPAVRSRAAGAGGAAPGGRRPQLPTATAPGARPLFLVVSSGTFARERVVWAARHGVRLVDRTLLQRWAAGEDLAVLLDLDLDHAQPNAS